MSTTKQNNQETARNEKELWGNVTKMLGNPTTVLGRHWSYNLHSDPKRLAFVLSRYKFSAKIIAKERSVLELGCSEGIGTPILSEFARSYTGVDADASAITTAKENWEDEKCRFIQDDFLEKHYGVFESIVSLDVIEHIHPEYEGNFFSTIAENLSENGECIIGTPNITSEAFASAPSKAGHVNLYDGNRLREAMQTIFHNVFLFGMNDEVVHTGFHPMAHYLLCLGCYKK